MRSYDVVMTPSDDGHWVLKSEADAVISKLEKEKDPVLNIVQEWMDISGFPKEPEVK